MPLVAGVPPAPIMVMRTTPLRNARSLLGLENQGGKVSGHEELRLSAGPSRELLWNNHLAVVNAALRHASREMALPVIDYESISMQLPDMHLHVRDGLHPQDKLLGTVFMDLLLNEYAAAQQRSHPVQTSAATRLRWSRNKLGRQLPLSFV